MVATILLKRGVGAPGALLDSEPALDTTVGAPKLWAGIAGVPVLLADPSKVTALETSRVLRAGDTMTGSLKFGSIAVGTPTDFTKHIHLHGAGYGLTVTGNRLNVVSGSNGFLLSGTTDVASWGPTGLQVLAGDVLLRAAPTNNLHAATKQYVDTYPGFVKKAGDTMTGGLTTTSLIIDAPGAYATISLVRNANENAEINSKTGTTLRWQMMMGDGTIEGGADAGSDFSLGRFNDAGAKLGNALHISRKTSIITSTGDFLVTKNNPYLIANKTGGIASLEGKFNNVLRWSVRVGSSDAETGGNTGSSFQIVRYSDTGAGIDNPLTISRATGIVDFKQLPTVNGGPWPAGPAGPTGPAGPPGAASTVPGPVGPAGPKGDTGAQGIPGVAGPKGDTGATGTAGATGPQGIPGVAGPKGDTGAAGAVGATGPTGPAGADGIDGATGPQGPVGATGPIGPPGAASTVPGPVGPAGADGFIPEPTGAGTFGRLSTGTWARSVALTGDVMTGLLDIGPGANGIRYSGIGGANDIGFSWEGTPRLNAWVDGTNVGALATMPDLAAYLPLTGGTLSGNLQIAPAAGWPSLSLDKTDGTGSQLLGRTTVGVLRWGITLGNATLETGANAGTNFALDRYDDAGNYIATSLFIDRATGKLTFSGNAGLDFYGGGGSPIRFGMSGAQYSMMDCDAARHLRFQEFYAGAMRLLLKMDPTNVFHNYVGPMAGVGPYQDLSDERGKMNVTPTVIGLAEVLQLEPISFNRIGEVGKEVPNEIGFSAQQVQPIIPEAVPQTTSPDGTFNEADPYLGLVTTPIVAALVNAVKELSARVTQLETS